MTNLYLYQYQQEHLLQIIECFCSVDRLLDTSKTGSGKTITSLFIYKSIRETYPDIPLAVICPPSLISNWKETLLQLELEGVVISSYSLKKANLLNYFLIVDEVHLFRNKSQMFYRLRSIVCKSFKVMYMSATPFDNERSSDCFRNLGILKTSIFSMQFIYSNKQSLQLSLYPLQDKTLRDYNRGVSLIRCSYDQTADVFRPGMYSKGFSKVQSNLYQFIRYEIERISKQHKIVIVGFFKSIHAHIKSFNPLLIDGDTSLNERTENIRKFQEPSLTHRILFISEQVGGLGICLDDKDGRFPRTMILLPSMSGINFVQTIGRIQRRTTKSKSFVRVIQPIHQHSYFKSNVIRKLNYLTKEIGSVPYSFSNVIRVHKTECQQTLNVLKECIRKEFRDIYSIIKQYTCSCIDKKEKKVKESKIKLKRNKK